MKIYNYGKGLDIVADLQASTKKVFLKQMKILFRTGNVKRFIPMDFVDRACSVASTLNSNLDKMTEEQEKYRQFLQDELKKLDEEEEKKR